MDGRAVEAVAVEAMGAAVIMEALTDEVPEPTWIASNVEDDNLTPTRGEEDPPTLIPIKAAAVDLVATALLAFEVTIGTTLLVFEVTIATALLIFTVTTALLVLAVVVTARASTRSTTGAAAANALNSVIVARSFILIDMLKRTRKRADREARTMARRTRDVQRE